MAVLFDLTNEKTGALLYGLNLNADRAIRHGFVQKYNVSGLGAVECVAVEQLTYAATWPGANTTNKIVAVWSDGSVTMDGAASVATAAFSTARWMKLVPVTVGAWYSVGGSWQPKNVLILYTDSKVYIFDPTAPVGGAYLYDTTRTTPSVPTAGSTSAGNIPAGTYRFVVTEISYHGIETLVSTAVSVTSATDFQVDITPAAAANADTVRYRLYMSKESDVTGNETYRLVDEVSSGAITANLKPTQLGLPYELGRIALPATASTGCIHQGVLVSAANNRDNTSVYVGAVTVDETGYGLTGFPEVGHAVSIYPASNMQPVVALASLQGNLLAFGKRSITGFYGDINDTTSVQSREFSSSVGTLNDRTIAVLGDKVFFSNYDGSRAFVTDGFSVQDITDGDHLFEGIWYALAGNQTMNYRGQLQGQFTANLVVADPYHNQVWFGGEIVSSTYASAVSGGSWSADALAANPQGNRQYVWRVFDLTTSKWLTWTNIPVKSYCVYQGSVWFGDHNGHLWQVNEVDAKDGATSGVLVTDGLTASSGTAVITLTSTWTGTAIEGAAVMLYNTSTGATQLRYAVSATTSNITVDSNVTVTANDVLFYGVPVADLWTQPMTESAKIGEISWMLLPQSQDGWGCMVANIKTRAAYTTWYKVATWLPATAGNERIAVGRLCPSMMLRVLLPAANAASSNVEVGYNFTIGKLKVGGKTLDGARF